MSFFRNSTEQLRKCLRIKEFCCLLEPRIAHLSSLPKSTLFFLSPPPIEL